MILGIQGTRSFDQYQTAFMRGMGRALSMLDEDKEFLVYSAGPSNINSMAAEFVNITERSLKSRGIKSKLIKVSPKWMKENISEFDFFLYFCNKKESYSEIYELADSKDIEAEIYRF